MRAMETWLSASDLDWTVMRPGGLFDAETVTNSVLRAGSSDAIFTSRADLAASMLAQLMTTDWIQKHVAVNTSDGAPTLLQTMRKEAFGRD